MTKNILFFVFILIIRINIITAQEFKEVLRVPWDTKDGIKTKMGTSENNGLLDFVVMDNNKVAFLCDIENKIRIYDITSGKMVHDFGISPRATNLTYSMVTKTLYVAAHNEGIHEYSIKGNLESIIEYNWSKIRSFTNMIFVDNSLVLDGNYIYTLMKDGAQLSFEKQLNSNIKGTMLNDGTVVENLGRINNAVQTIILSNKEGEFKYDINCYEKARGINSIGKIGDTLVLREYYKDEVENKYHKFLVLYSLSKQKMIAKVKMPNIKFTYVKNDIKVLNDKVYHLITTPKNARLFQLDFETLERTKGDIKLKYPNDLNYEFHYMELLPKDGGSNIKSLKSGASCDIGTRSEVIARAYKYLSIQWRTSENNFPCGTPMTIGMEADIGVKVDDGTGRLVPYMVTVPTCVDPNSTNTAMVYKWGGWTHYNSFAYHLANDKVVGDNKSGPCELNDDHVIGIDCSGFVTRAWDMSKKYSTGNLPGIDVEIDFTELKAGDILNNKGSHVMLVTGPMDDDNNIVVWEASGTGKVRENIFNESELGSYKAHPMPMQVADYDLVFTTSDVSTPVSNGHIAGYASIRNVGTQTYSGKLRMAIYRQPNANASAEVGSLVYVSGTTNFNIPAGREDYFSFNESVLSLNLSADNYIVRYEYERARTSGSVYSNIPAENYTEDDAIIICINGKEISGIVYAADGVNPSPYMYYVISNSKKGSKSVYSGYADFEGKFKEVLPNDWRSGKISFPGTDYKDFSFDIPGGDLAIYKEGSSQNWGGGGSPIRCYTDLDGLGFYINENLTDHIVGVCLDAGITIKAVNPNESSCASGKFIINNVTRSKSVFNCNDANARSCYNGWTFCECYYQELFISIIEVDDNLNPIGEEAEQWVNIHPAMKGTGSGYLESFNLLDYLPGGTNLVAGKKYKLKIANSADGWEEYNRYIAISQEKKLISGALIRDNIISEFIEIENSTIFNQPEIIAGQSIKFYPNTSISSGLFGINDFAKCLNTEIKK